MTIAPIAQRPRLDVGLIIIIAVMLLSGAVFFGTCSSTHADGGHPLMRARVVCWP